MTDIPSLLLIDDEPDVLESYKMMLEENGFCVHTAGNKKEALAVLEEYPIGVALIDLKMGEENGLQVSGELRKADSFIKILIITAYPTYDTAVDAIKMGVSDYVSKTTDPRELVKKIETALEIRRNEINAKVGGTQSNQKRVVLVCNHVLNREGIQKFCDENPHYHLLHSYPSIRFIAPGDFNHQAELLLICMDCTEQYELDSPHETFPRLRTLFPNARPLILNSKLNEQQKIDLIKNGVRGFLAGDISKEKMGKAFAAVLKNQLWISRDMTLKLLNQLLDNQLQKHYPKDKSVMAFNLSKREVETLQAMASGLSNHEISEKFFISENTVKIHINHIFKKLNVKSRTQAVIKGRESGII